MTLWSSRQGHNLDILMGDIVSISAETVDRECFADRIILQ
jgi:hypothetical protein